MMVDVVSMKVELVLVLMRMIDWWIAVEDLIHLVMMLLVEVENYFDC